MGDRDIQAYKNYELWFDDTYSKNQKIYNLKMDIKLFCEYKGIIANIDFYNTNYLIERRSKQIKKIKDRFNG